MPEFQGINTARLGKAGRKKVGADFHLSSGAIAISFSLRSSHHQQDAFNTQQREVLGHTRH
jgi:hypothetical protein